MVEKEDIAKPKDDVMNNNVENLAVSIEVKSIRRSSIYSTKTVECPTVIIAKELDTSIGTVHNHIKKLVKSSVIKIQSATTFSADYHTYPQQSASISPNQPLY